MSTGDIFPVPKDRRFVDYGEIPSALQTEARYILKAYMGRTAKTDSPRLIHLCGIPGSGKTTYAGEFIELNKDFAWLQFDAVMQALAGYREDCKSKGLEEAFRRWELPARNIGYHVLQLLLEERRNILFDHSATDRRHIMIIAKAKCMGYVTEMHHMECDLETALERVRRRESIIERHTPENLLHERKELLAEILPVYRHLVGKFVSVGQKSMIAHQAPVEVAV